MTTSISHSTGTISSVPDSTGTGTGTMSGIPHSTRTDATSVDSAVETSDRRDSATHRRLGRAATVIGAAVITTAVFLVARAMGADFTITDPGEGKVPHTFVAAEIAMVTVVFGLLGWATLAALERWTSRARAIWSGLALGIVLLSLVPIWIERATASTRIGLAVVHVVVGLALLPLLRFGRPDSTPATRD